MTFLRSQRVLIYHLSAITTLLNLENLVIVLRKSYLGFHVLELGHECAAVL